MANPSKKQEANGTSRLHNHEVRPRKDKRGVDLISDALPFGRLWYDGPKPLQRNRLRRAPYSRAHHAVIRVYDERWQRDRDARARGRFQGVVSGLAILQPLRHTSLCENHEKTYLAVAAFDNPRGDACDRGEELGADPRSHN